jgi:mitochondrial FAD-linked sulfhydryl oxidase
MAESTTKGSNATKLPPGMIIGPDGKPCKSCMSWRDWSRHTKAKAQSTSKSQPSIAGAATATATTTAQDTQLAASVRPENCPPDVEQLGRATWTFLHTTAAYYPERPTPNQRVNMLTLLRSLPTLYPCSHCATHLGEDLKDHPPDVSGRLGLSRWLCERHNEVNERLGKPLFNCTLPKLDERWKDGPKDGSCD